jgi:hypothetical protein
VDSQAAVEPPAVERQIAHDLVRRGLPIAPVIVLIAGLVGGWTGAASAAVAIAIVFANFLAAAAIMTWAAGTGSPGAVGGAAAGGFAVRLVVILLALVLLRNLSWIDLPTLGFVLVGLHLGLLAWEAKYVSMTLAAPGLRPARPVRTGEE